MPFRRNLGRVNAIQACSSINIQLCGKQAAVSEMSAVMKSWLSGLCKHTHTSTQAQTQKAQRVLEDLMS